jgi:hypothetical protein
MTNSDTKQRAERTISDILSLLNEEHLRREIDERIDQASTAFQTTSKAVPSHRGFHEAISAFTGHIYEHGLRIPQRLSACQALGEALSILQQGYRNADTNGYDAALLDAMSPDQNGIEIVLSRMGEVIKATERQKYIRWVFASRLGPSDWHTRCHIAQVLLQRGREFLPAELLRCPPAQLADHCSALIITYLNAENLLRQMSVTEPSFLSS